MRNKQKKRDTLTDKWNNGVALKKQDFLPESGNVDTYVMTLSFVAVWSCSWHSSGDFLATCSMDNTAKVWDLNRLETALVVFYLDNWAHMPAAICLNTGSWETMSFNYTV